MLTDRCASSINGVPDAESLKGKRHMKESSSDQKTSKLGGGIHPGTSWIPRISKRLADREKIKISGRLRTISLSAQSQVPQPLTIYK